MPAGELGTHDAKITIERLVLIGRVDGDMVKTEIVQNEAMKAMVLSEPTGSIAGRHEEGGPLMIEVGVLDQLHHIPCGHDAGVTLFAGSEFPSPVEGLFVRFRE